MSMISSIAASSSLLAMERLQTQTSVSTLKKALDVKKDISSQLVEALTSSTPVAQVSHKIDICA